MQRIPIEDLESELAAVMGLRWTQGYTVEQALCIARQKQESIQANYRLWALNPTNDKALREARENCFAIDYVVRVLEAGAALEEAQEATAPAVAPVMAQDATEVVEPVKVSKGRCPHYASIKTCFAAFIECGLSTEPDSMRSELSRLLGVSVASRRALTGAQWMLAAERARREAWAY
jgi:hypothetical protein